MPYSWHHLSTALSNTLNSLAICAVGVSLAKVCNRLDTKRQGILLTNTPNFLSMLKAVIVLNAKVGYGGNTLLVLEKIRARLRFLDFLKE